MDRGRARRRGDPGYPDVVARDDSPGQVRENAAAVAWLLGLLAVFGAVCSAPFVVAHACGEGWGVVAGIALGAAWMRWMPTTCFNGGLIWSMLGIWQVLLLCLWVLRAVLLGVKLIWG